MRLLAASQNGAAGAFDFGNREIDIGRREQSKPKIERAKPRRAGSC
jgi:hypothetical protein